MPNFLNQNDQKEAGDELKQFFPLFKVNCSPDIKSFLCFLYFPVCVENFTGLMQPCRELCQSARHGCESLMRKFGFSWPPNFECSKFPSIKNVVCAHTNKTSLHDFESASFNNLPTNVQTNTGADFVCPLQFQVADSSYRILIGDKITRHCGAPCYGMFFDRDSTSLLRQWVFAWSCVCSVFCAFTVVSFLLNSDRFQYPERPVIYIAICYLVLSLTYLLAYMMGDQIACNQPLEAPTTHIAGSVRMVSTIVQGTRRQLCTFVFMLLYFFTMASCVWWVVLTLTWFMAGALKWGQEAIEAHSQYFHLGAWSLPAIKTISILSLGSIEGDVLSGVCYIGIYNTEMLRSFLFVPHTIYLLAGLLLLGVGFVKLFQVRAAMKSDGSRTDKLEKTMLRIGLFAVLYALPLSVLVACFFYEYAFMHEWMLGWQQRRCSREDAEWSLYSIPCPTLPPHMPPASRLSQPHFGVFMIKYAAMLAAGIGCGVWVWTPKTLRLWTRLCCASKKSRCASVEYSSAAYNASRCRRLTNSRL